MITHVPVHVLPRPTSSANKAPCKNGLDCMSSNAATAGGCQRCSTAAGRIHENFGFVGNGIPRRLHEPSISSRWKRVLSIHLSCLVTVLIDSNVGTSNSDNGPAMFDGPKFHDVSSCHSAASLMKQVWLLYRESWIVLRITPLGVAFKVVAAFDFAF